MLERPAKTAPGSRAGGLGRLAREETARIVLPARSLLAGKAAQPPCSAARGRLGGPLSHPLCPLRYR